MIKKYGDFLSINEHHPGAVPVQDMIREGIKKLMGGGFTIPVIIEALSFYLDFYKINKTTAYSDSDIMDFKEKKGISIGTDLNSAINSLRQKFILAEEDWYDEDLIMKEIENVIKEYLF